MTSAFVRTASPLLFALSILGVGCAAEQANETTAGTTADALSNAKVKLPAGDPCRDVLAPLALGLASGALGLDFTTGITVSATSETDTRLYTIALDGVHNSARYMVELDNDSHSKCLLLSASSENGAALDDDPKTSVRSGERTVSAPVTVSPANDDCASTVKLLAGAAGVSAVGEQGIVQVSASLESADEDRSYRVKVDGQDFSVSGTRFANDYVFALETSNDSASKCFVQKLALGTRL